MRLRPVNDEFAVTEQITVADVEALAAQGVKSLLCNRPDGEAPDQPAYADIEAAARRLGMSVRSVPVVASQSRRRERLQRRVCRTAPPLGGVVPHGHTVNHPVGNGPECQGQGQ